MDRDMKKAVLVITLTIIILIASFYTISHNVESQPREKPIPIKDIIIIDDSGFNILTDIPYDIFKKTLLNETYMPINYQKRTLGNFTVLDKYFNETIVRKVIKLEK